MSILFFIAILALLILSHELGHFIFAKLKGVKVEEFGFGFPPRLLSFKKGETIYSLNLLPLGGFVKIFGENGPSTSSRQARGTRPTSDVGVNETSDVGRAFYSKPASSKALILSAGVIFNFLLAWIIFSISFSIGAPIGQDGGNFEIIKFSWYEAIWQGLKTTVLLAGAIITAVFYFFKAIFSGAGAQVLEQIAGPVGIFGIIGSASKLGLTYVLELAAFLSLNLAIINFLPFPALDGGRLLFLGIEVLKGSPLNQKWSNFAHTLGFVILIALMILVTYKDILRI